MNFIKKKLIKFSLLFFSCIFCCAMPAARSNLNLLSFTRSSHPMPYNFPRTDQRDPITRRSELLYPTPPSPLPERDSEEYKNAFPLPHETLCFITKPNAPRTPFPALPDRNSKEFRKMFPYLINAAQPQQTARNIYWYGQLITYLSYQINQLMRPSADFIMDKYTYAYLLDELTQAREGIKLLKQAS